MRPKSEKNSGHCAVLCEVPEVGARGGGGGGGVGVGAASQ